jgi:NADH-quinone oxidoreductase subunit N
MTVLAFFVLAVIRRNGRGDSLEDLRGLSRSSPLLALLMTVAMASLAGVPLTVGFLGKMMVFMTAVDHGYWGVVGCAVVSAAAGFYYYFRVILAVYSGDNSQTHEPIRLALPTRIIAVSLAVIVVIAGVYPRPIQRAITAAPTTAQAK